MPPPSGTGLSTLLEQMASGQALTAVQLTGLSDLDREAIAALRAGWERMPAPLRETVVQRAGELAEDNVDLDFTQLARVALGDSAPAVRRRAAEALWESEDRRVARDLASALADADGGVRAAAASALRHFVFLLEYGELDAASADAVTEALRGRAEDPAEATDVRARAVEALGARTLPWVERVIMTAYYADDARLRVAAVRAMGDSADERYLEYLEEQASSDDPLLRYEAATSAGGIASEDALAFLIGLLEDEDREVRMAAIRALGEIGGDGALEALRGLHPRDADLREAVGDAITVAASGGAGGIPMG